VSFAKAEELVQLANMASRRRGVSLAEICEAFGCVRRTAQRMTVALEKAFPATEQRVDDERRTRWVLPAKPAVQLLSATPEEMAALTAAVALLDRNAMSTEAVLVRRLEAKVRALIPPPEERRLAVDEEALLEALGHAARPGPRLATDVAVDSAIFAALKGPYRLRMVYRSRRDNASRERTVAPHGLLLGARRYLVARDLSKADAPLQHYRVEDIEAAEVLAESFEFDAGFDIRDHARRGFASFVNDEEHGEVVWRFKPHAAAQARRYLFHPTQVLQEEADGSLLVRFEASGHLEMCWHLYAWGDTVEVLAPEALRRMVDGFRRSDFPALP
jgi:predicted DNA-binding transcriptional regulator YafY